jgi:hypothetical protein
MAKKKRQLDKNWPDGIARRRREVELFNIQILSEKIMLPHLPPDNFLGKIF